MFEILSAIYTFWNFVDDANTLRKALKVSRKYASFLYWYLKNPEVRVKYVNLVTKKRVKKQNAIDVVYINLLKNNKRFGDGFVKTDSQLTFELIDSKLNYRIVLDELNNQKENVKIETKFMPFYPLRRFRKLNQITSEFNDVAEIIKSPFNIKVSNQVVHIEVEIDNENNSLQRFKKYDAEIVFKGKKIQINNFRGSEQGEFMLYFVMKWIAEYRESNKITQ